MHRSIFGSPGARYDDFMVNRDLYIDHLRSVMIALILLQHTAVTYGAPGEWFWHELLPNRTTTGVILATFTSTNQAYLVGLFSLLAAYYTPGSLEHKGYRLYLWGRFLRLGLPLLLVGFGIGPFTKAMLISNTKDDGIRVTFARNLPWVWKHDHFLQGPLWFPQVLLAFALVYCVWRSSTGIPLSEAQPLPKPIPRYTWWLGTAIAVGGASLGLWQVIPAHVVVFGIQPGYLVGYIFLFMVGLAAWRYNWIRQLTWKRVRLAVLTSLFLWPLFPAVVVLAHILYPPPGPVYVTGFGWTTVFVAMWQPIVGWGLLAGCLLLFKEKINQSTKLWTWVDRRAYAVYVFHPPILVALSLFLHEWQVPTLLKFGVTGILTCLATWIVADLALRLPFAQRVL